MKKILLLSFFFNLFFFSNAQQNPLWTRLSADKTTAIEKFERKSTPKESQIYSLNFELLKSKLATAPSKEDNKTKAGIVIAFPTAEGKLENFKVYEASIMHPDLAARYQEIQSYVGVGVEDPSSTIRFSVTLFGLHTMTFRGTGETTYIDTYTRDLKKYIVYNRSQLSDTNGFFCEAREADNSPSDKTSYATQSNAGISRVYRLAISSTIEYSTFHINAAGLSNGTTAQKRAAVLAAMVVTMTRVNGLYERDAAISMQLIANNDILISLNSEDNFTNNSGGTLLGENQAFVDANIGNGNYDIGHIFSTGGGGIARRGSVCLSSLKAQGVTGSPAPINDAFNIDYVAHEMGHQFGANHTFNSNLGSCEGNGNPPTAVEPASGTTIMAYAGICFADDIQAHSDAHFSVVSLAEINNHVTNAGNCSVNTAANNTAPVVYMVNYTIPKSTPFILKGSATDAENDALTYCWEQNNPNSETGVTTSGTPSPTNTAGPNFRSRPPLTSPERYIPALASVVSNNLAQGYEVIPSVARVLKFALTVRDNSAVNGPQTNRGDMTVTVANVGPFLVMSPNTSVSWTVGSNQTVTWDVAGTTANNINSYYVDIYLSTNSGGAFNTLLASNVPNDGSEIITVPNNIGANNRIMVRSHDNIFYDVSNSNFSIVAAPTPTPSLAYNGQQGQQNISGCIASTAVYTLNYAAVAGFTGTTTFTATGNPSGSTVTFSPASITSSGTVTATVSNLNGGEGFYPIVITATSGAITKIVNVYLNVIEGTFLPITLSTPANGATQQSTDVTLTWIADPIFATAYDVQMATDSQFLNIDNFGTVTESSFPTLGLNSGTTYYWRVTPRNAGCSGDFSETYHFTTASLGVNDNLAFNFSVYPNPNTGNFNIQSSKLTSDKIQIQVYDMRGRIIYNKECIGSSSFNENIQLKNAEAGVYLLSVSDGLNKDVKRIIIK